MRRVVSVLLVAGTASAQPVRLEVTTDSCPSLRDAISGGFASEAQASIHVDERERTATITLNNGTLDNGDGSSFGTRVIHASSCEELARSVAVVVEMVLPGIAALPEPQPLPPSDAVENAIAALKKIEPVFQAPDFETTEHIEVVRPHHDRFEMTAFAGVSTSFGTELALGLRRRWGSMSLGGELAGALPDAVSESHAAVQRVSAALIPCDHLGALAVCGVVRAGVDRGVGQDLMDEHAAIEPLFELGSRLSWERPVTDHLALTLMAELDLALTSTQFDIDHVAVWHSSRFEGLAGAGVVVRFP
jgi:hypothetical protein